MKKVITKSVILTVLILVVVVLVGQMTLSIFFPQTVSDIALKFNDKTACANYQEKAYKKSPTFDNLALLTERSILANDDDKIIIYAEKFIDDENFIAYANSVDESYAYYIASSLVTSLYNKGYTLKSIETAFMQTVDFEHVGPVHRLIALASEKGDKQTLITIKQKLITINNNVYVNNLVQIINEEINKIN